MGEWANGRSVKKEHLQCRARKAGGMQGAPACNFDRLRALLGAVATATAQSKLNQWIAAATMMLMPRHMAATTMPRALFCFSTISRHRS